MKQMIPLSKQSKRVQKEYHKKQRGSWCGLNPVTRTVPNKKAYDRIDVIVKKGQRQIIKDFAASQGKSLNRFICDAIEYQMEQANKEKE